MVPRSVKGAVRLLRDADHDRQGETALPTELEALPRAVRPLLIVETSRKAAVLFEAGLGTSFRVAGDRSLLPRFRRLFQSIGGGEGARPACAQWPSAAVALEVSRNLGPRGRLQLGTVEWAARRWFSRTVPIWGDSPSVIEDLLRTFADAEFAGHTHGGN